MKEEIEQWRKNNGNVTYSMKELLQGMHVKIDDNHKDIINMIDSINSNCKICNSQIDLNKNNIAWHKYFIVGLYGALGALVLLML